jgi:hypothetical protein
MFKPRFSLSEGNFVRGNPPQERSAWASDPFGIRELSEQTTPECVQKALLLSCWICLFAQRSFPPVK